LQNYYNHNGRSAGPLPSGNRKRSRVGVAMFDQQLWMVLDELLSPTQNNRGNAGQRSWSHGRVLFPGHGKEDDLPRSFSETTRNAKLPSNWPAPHVRLKASTGVLQSFPQRILGASDQKRFQSPKTPILSGAPCYGVRRPEAVPVPQGTHRVRRTQRKARRTDAGSHMSASICINR
jgi:hypothetical protein